MAPSLFDVDDTIGAALIGFAVSCVFFGVLSTQCFVYYMRYPLDRPLYRALVVAIWCLELFHQILIGHTVYFYTITNFNSPAKIILGDVAWSLILQIVVGALVGTIVKACFAMRVWRFSNRNIPVTGTLMVLIFGQFGCAIAYSVRAFQASKFTEAPKLTVIASISLGAGTLTDILAAAALCFYLRRLRTGYSGSDSLVNTLTIYAINTGALTAAISLVTLITYNMKPSSFMFIAFYFVLSKLYANSFMGTLNTRKTVRGKGTDRQATGLSGTSGATNVQMFGGHSFNMPNGQRVQGSGQGLQSKSQLEIGVHQVTSITDDTELQLSVYSSPSSPVGEKDMERPEAVYDYRNMPMPQKTQYPIYPWR